MPFPALIAAEDKLAAKQKSLRTIFDEAGPDMDMSKVKSLTGDSADKVKAIREMNAELNDLGEEVKGLREVEAAAEAARKGLSGGSEGGDGARDGDPDDRRKGGPVPAQRKSFGRLFVESKAFTEKKGSQGPVASIDYDVKALMTTSAGFAPEVTRTGRIVEFAQRPIQVTDLIPSTTTSQAAIKYMEETTSTSGAAEIAEGGTYSESTFVFTEQTSNVRKIGTILPVTDEQLEDEVYVEGFVDNRLGFFLAQRLDGQILVGNGTSPNLRGFLNVAGLQTQAKGADPGPDAAYKAMVKVRVTGRATPSAFIYHPTNWQDIRLLKTVDGIYIWGSPSEAVPDRIWGLPVAQSDAITLGTALTGDFPGFSELSIRRGIEIKVSDSHSTYFAEGKQAIRADMRAALVIYRPPAFCTVTGL